MFFLRRKSIPLTEIFTESFVDIHSHLLPGIDDGAKDLDHSIDLIKKMSSYGIKNFITTPHVLGDVYPNSPEIILSKLDEVQKRLKVEGLSDIKISASAEYMLDEQFTSLLDKDTILPLKKNYILVEMSYFNAPVNLYEVLFEIQLKGYKPILAHPERYNFYHNDFENYYKLKKSGCLFQLNMLSLTDHYGSNIQKVSKKLLDLGLYDFLGTDTHHSRHLDLMLKLGNLKHKKMLENLIQRNAMFE